MHSRAQAWYGRRTWHWRDWPAEVLLESKRRAGARISVVIPARNEERTIAGVVGSLRAALVERIPLIDEVVVIDSDSADGTAAAAAKVGGTVHGARDIAPELGGYPGKGEALWKSLLVTEGDLLVFIDADLTQWGPHFVTGLLGPLLADPGVQLVKGFYARIAVGTDGSTSTEGGRVTELVARPLLSLWWPELSGVVQPLAGEWAARRELMESLSVPVGYGVELSTLLDTAATRGLDAIAQVDLGSRGHKHQTDHDLALMAAELLIVAERRRRPAGADARQPAAPAIRQGRHPGPPGGPADSGSGAAAGDQPVLRQATQPPRQPPVSSAASSSPDVAGPGNTEGQRTLRLGGRSFEPRQRLIMAIVNRTPDSFYDRGATWEEAAAMERVHEVVGEGADIVDIGGVPAAPGAEVTVAEEIRRTVPFVAAVRAAYPDLVISVDTWRHQTARELCAAGADLLNDTWGGWDEQLPEVAAEYGAGLVCSHAGGLPPRTRPFRVEYDDVMTDVLERTLTLADRAVARGVDPSRVIIDPAHDFGKNTWQSLEVTRRLDEMVAADWPVLVSLSHKDFIGETLNAERDERLTGTLATTAVCAWLGARVFRAHQVTETREVLDMVSAIRGDRPPARAVRGLA